MGRYKLRSRVYYCDRCEFRHTAPTDENCPHGANLPQKSVGKDMPERPEHDETRTQQKELKYANGDSTATNTTGVSHNNPSLSTPQPELTGTMMILGQLVELRRETQAQRVADREYTQKAIADLAAKVETPTMSDDD